MAAKYVHETHIGRYIVQDDGVPVLPDANGTADLTLADVARYEQRAARTVLRLADEVDGDVVRFARKAMGLRQPELADLLDVRPETVSRWENGQEPVRRATQLAIASLLDEVEKYGADEVKKRLDKKPRHARGRVLRVG